MPTRIGRYQLVTPLGAGSFGEVFEAVDVVRGDRVALKLLRRESPEAVARFKREFRVLRELVHPNLVALDELGRDGDRWYFTMALVDGARDVTRWLGGGVSAVPTIATEDSAAPAVGAPVVLEPARLGAVLIQLADALDAVHAAGRLHCDLKPANVLVDCDGRLRLCDFGLVAELGARGPEGTAWFAAPEQLAGLALGPATDWYAVGALLYEAHAGRPPFVGSADEVRAAKQAGLPPALAALAPGAAPAVAALVDRLLAREPAARPGSAEVRAVAASLLGGAAPAAIQIERDAALVGRARELALLAEAWRAAAAGPVVVRVVGPSGIGKTALCRAALAALPADTWVLAGRCYDREHMPFRAVDPIVDAAVARLAALPVEVRATLVPRELGALARWFPVVRTVVADAEAVPPGEVRTRAFAAARALVARLAAHARLVLWIDDWQWSDEGSASLLTAALTGPGGPPVLCLLSSRTDDAAAPALTVDGLERTRLLSLEPLPDGDAAALARSLGRADDADAIAREAGGSPFWVRELARVGAGRGAGSVDELVRARVGGLDAGAQAVLTTVAVAGGPLDEATAIAAASVDGPVERAVIVRLRAAGLLRAAGVSGAVDTYHDRVREAVVDGLAAAARRAVHGRLARALSAAGGDGERVARHQRDAGDHAAARATAHRAAAHALAVGTPERAAALYALAAEVAADDDERRSMLTARGEALAVAGHGPASAAAFVAAAAAAPPLEALRLRRRAAELLLRAGHVEPGRAAAAEVLAAHGVPWRRGPRGLVASLVWQRARLAVRGTRPRSSAVDGGVAARELERIDALWGLAAALSMTDHLRGAELQVRNLRAALAAGEPVRLSRSLTLEAIYSATAGGRGRARSRGLIARAAALAEDTGDPLARAMILLAEGVCAHQAGEWPAARDRCARAIAALEPLPATFHELASARFFWLEALLYLGELDTLAAAVPRFLDDAARRGDAYALVYLRGGPATFRWIVTGEVSRGLSEVRTVAAELPRDGFHVPHLLVLLSEVQLLLAAGDADGAWDRLARDWRALERSFLLQAQNVLVEMVALRGRVALASGRAALARRAAARIRRERVPWGDALAALLEAALAPPTDATAAWARAAAACDASAMPLHAAAARSPDAVAAAVLAPRHR